jgi:hypothetical protein
MSKPVIEPRYHDRPAHSLVTVPTELFRLLLVNEQREFQTNSDSDLQRNKHKCPFFAQEYFFRYLYHTVA